MALTFEYEKDLDTGAQPYISHEPNSVLYNYFIQDATAKDKNALASFGHYDNIFFDNEGRHLSSKAVAKIGIKNFPGIGGIGFYKDAYSDNSLILAPIHTDRTRYKAPTLLTAEILGDKLHIIIQPVESIKYNCYRIIVRQAAFAFEYITYKLECFVDIPTVKGNYDVYCIGYDEDNGVISEDSNILQLTIATGNPDWLPRLDDMSDLIARIDSLEEAVEELEKADDPEAPSEPVQLVVTNISASSEYSADYSATKAIDNILTTRWASANKASGIYLLIELPSIYTIADVRLKADSSYLPEAVSIQVSTDNATYQEVTQGTISEIDTFSILSIQKKAKYIKILFLTSAHTSFYSITELQVYGTFRNS